VSIVILLLIFYCNVLRCDTCFLVLTEDKIFRYLEMVHIIEK